MMTGMALPLDALINAFSVLMLGCAVVATVGLSAVAAALWPSTPPSTLSGSLFQLEQELSEARRAA